VRAREYVNSVEYTGPIALACDDTKLHPSLQVYWDTVLETHVLVGTTSTEVIVVANPEELERLLVEYKDKAATKVRTVVYLVNRPLICSKATSLVHSDPVDWNSLNDGGRRSNS